MGVDVMGWSEIYDDGVKANAAIGVTH